MTNIAFTYRYVFINKINNFKEVNKKIKDVKKHMNMSIVNSCNCFSKDIRRNL